MRNLTIALALALVLCGCENTESQTGEPQTEQSTVKFTGASETQTQTEEAPVTTPVNATQEQTEQTPPAETETSETEVLPEEVETQTEGDQSMTLDDLTSDDLAEIEILRENIFSGINVGEDLYIKQVNLALEDLGLYDGNTVWDVDASLPDVSSCPFVEFYGNVKPLSEASCEYLVDQARSDAYSKLAAVLQTERENFNSVLSEEDFWYEQGAISGLEKTRVVLHVQMKSNSLCNQTPTPVESSYEKGLVTGRQHFTNTMNNWLTTNGHKADYPVMSEPVEVCDANTAVLDPVYDEALSTISQVTTPDALCGDYEPTTGDEELMFGQAVSDFAKAVQQGIADEFALAAVKIFEVVPCNVSDPIVLDMNRNEKIDITPVHKGTNFNMTGSRVQATAWLDGDGFLFYDRNSNLIADDGTEFFGTSAKFSSGFEELAQYDLNSDGIIDPKDPVFKGLRVWIDANGDGVSTQTETRGAYALKLVIPTTHVKKEERINGSTVKATSWSYSMRMGKILTADVDLRVATWERIVANR